MSNYYVKQDLYGVKAGRVERFAHHKAGALLIEGAIEPYDEKNKRHREAPGSPESEAKASAERARERERKLLEAVTVK